MDDVDFTIYRDDGLGILAYGEDDIPAYLEHLDGLHPNLKWDTNYGREGPYLDLDLKIEEGKIKSKVFTKSEPIYLPPNSCHDPAVFKGFYKRNRTTIAPQLHHGRRLSGGGGTLCQGSGDLRPQVSESQVCPIGV